MAGKKFVLYDEDEVGIEGEESEPADGDALQGDDDEDEEDEEEGHDEYEKDDFIVDELDEDEEERADSEERKGKKKKRREYRLDEDDYELLQENNVTGFHRPKLGCKEFKRLKKEQRGTDEEFDRSGKTGRTAEEKLKRTLFGDDEGPPLEDIAEDEEQPEEVEGDTDEEDEMANFIVDGLEVDEHGLPVRRRKLNKKRSRQAPGVSLDALQDANEIFGDVDEFSRLRKGGKYDGSGESGERIFEDEFEPIVLSEKYLTEKDNGIQEIDLPERMQISQEGTGPPPSDEMSIEEESNWIYNQLVTSIIPLFSKSRTGTSEGELELSVNKIDIMRFLEFMHVQKLDVPFIAMYQKEECLSLFRDPEQHEAVGWNQNKPDQNLFGEPEEHEGDNQHKPDQNLFGEPEGREDDNQNKPDQKPTIQWHKVLWAIHDLDRKWLLLQKRKSALQSYYNKRFEEESSRIYDETRLTLNQQLFESITKSLKATESEREVDDVDSKFNLHFPPGEVVVDEGQYKRPKRKSQYSICSKAGLWEFASKFGYSSEQFGLQISLEKMRMDELEDAKETPEEMASNFTCSMFETPQAVLRGARHMVAVEISCEPCVRKHVRSTFMDNAVVSTTPTPDGNRAIDTFHQFAGVKWLREKPLSRFEDAQWLLIQKAEEEKLLQVTIKLPDTVLNKLVADSTDFYLSHGVCKSAQLWNEQRKMILQDAYFGFLLPSMDKEARSFLTSRAKNWLLMEYGKLLWEKVSVAPYQRKEHDVSTDDDTALRVMACCWAPGKPSTTFVMLDSSGEVVDTLNAGFLSTRSQNINDQQRRKNDHQRVVKFITDHQPHVVVLGAVNLSCTRLKDDIYEIISKIVEDNPRDVGHGMDGLSIVFGDETLPHLYENSRISSDQLSGHTGIVRRAIALGRFLQNPLAMVATLCGPGREILSWKLSPLESFLTPDEKYGMVEQVMVDVTNQVGLDVNLAIAHEWLFAPLQFIAGLGPRKAASLQRSLVRAGSIYTRKELVSAHGLRKKVFVNAAGFLRIRRTGLLASSSQFIDLLDDTRIHPTSYGLAKQLANFVCKKDGNDDDDDDDANDDEDVLEMAVEHVREKPDLLKYFKVDEYTKSKGKRETLNHIRLELIQGFQDWRRQYTEPSQDDEFNMISGETGDTLAEGRIVQVTVRRVQPQRAVCGLESGLTGMLTNEDYTDESRDDFDLTEKLHEGDILTCRIKSIQKNRYQVFLTCKESDMKSNFYQSERPIDPFYHEDQSSSQTVPDKVHKEKELAKKHFKRRMIVHPRFQNITEDEAIEFLSEKDPGESIVRPSSRGPSFLTLTLKVYDGVYAHKDIVEGGKEHKDITSLLRIGKTLKIGEDTFEDLDEVMDRYVNPLVTHLKAMLSYRKFRKGTKAEVDELLKFEKSEYPMRIVYCFGISYEHPGTFLLTYIRSTNPHHEFIGLYPKGFKFRKKMFEDTERLLAYFQRHIDDPQQTSGPPIRSVAATVPMRSPAIGGSSGGSFSGGFDNGGGWRGQSMDQDGTTPGSQSGRGNYRNGGNRDGHPSGLPRPNGGRGRGRGRGRGNGNDRQDSNDGSQKWDSKDGDNGWSSGGGGSSWGGGGGLGQGSGSGGGGAGGWQQGSGGGGGGGSGSGWGGGGSESGSGGWGKGSGSGGGGGSESDGGGSGWGSGGWGKGSGSSGGGGSESGRGGSGSDGGGGGWGKGSGSSGGGGSESGKGGSASGGGGWGTGSGSGGGGGNESGRGGSGSDGGGSGWGSGGGGWGKGSGSDGGGGSESGWGGGGSESGRGGSDCGGGGWGKGSGGGRGGGSGSDGGGRGGGGVWGKGSGSSGGGGSESGRGGSGSDGGGGGWGKGSGSSGGGGSESGKGGSGSDGGSGGWGTRSGSGGGGGNESGRGGSGSAGGGNGWGGGGSCWGQGSSGSAAGCSGDVEADPGNSGWGGSKRSSVQQEAGNGGWPGTSGGGSGW